MSNEKETVVVSNGGGGASWFIAGILFIALIVGGYFIYNGYFNQGSDISVELEVPEAITPN